MGVSEQPVVRAVVEDRLTTDDQRLVAAILRKDRKATAEFVCRYTDAIHGYVSSRLFPRREKVDDLIQEIFLAAWENLAGYRGASPLESWLMGIARHKVEDYYRGCLREPESLETSQEEAEADKATSNPSFDDILDGERLHKKTWQTLAKLPEKYRLALLWRYWDKCSAREMAARTGKTEKAIERLLARARAEFRWMWNHE